MLSQQRQVWQSPFPPPDAAERFEQLCPGTFARILTMVEADQAARIESNKAAQSYTTESTRRGHWLGAGLSIAAMAASLLCLYLGNPYIAALFLGVPLTAIARSFITGTAQPVINPPPTEAPPHEP